MIINPHRIKDCDLLVICPTRQRIEKLTNMYKSYSETITSNTGIILCVDVDDSSEYDFNCTISVELHKTNTQIINDIFYKYPDYKYYMVINDDVVFKTMGWDYKMMNVGINYADGGTGQDFPFFSVIEGNIPRKLGWLQMPKLEYLYGDNCWKHIMDASGIGKYHKDITIEHKHYLLGHEIDSIYKKTNSADQYKKDNHAFIDWLVTKSHIDIERIHGKSKGFF